MDGNGSYIDKKKDSGSILVCIYPFWSLYHLSYEGLRFDILNEPQRLCRRLFTRRLVAISSDARRDELQSRHRFFQLINIHVIWWFLLRD